MDGCLKFCDRMDRQQVKKNRDWLDPQPPALTSGAVFFPRFCAFTSSPMHTALNKAVMKAKFYTPILVDDNFVLRGVSRADDFDSTALCAARKKY